MFYTLTQQLKALETKLKNQMNIKNKDDLGITDDTETMSNENSADTHHSSPSSCSEIDAFDATPREELLRQLLV